ncbi:MAG: hypothetical protein K1X47_17855 [Cyclobacteriaceae bacterium]|nr:hypothetical protein [Cyclobacteriaceae bacterium]
MKGLIQLVLAALLTVSCNPMPEKKSTIDELGRLYPNYEFRHFPEFIDNYLELHLQGAKIDSAEISEIYQHALRHSTDSVGNRKWPFTHLIVYDSSGDYLFTVSGTQKAIRFFNDPVH